MRIIHCLSSKALFPFIWEGENIIEAKYYTHKNLWVERHDNCEEHLLNLFYHTVNSCY